jgi:ketosteroid isomerase-like protein
MRRISVFVTIALLAGFVSGYFARSAADMFQGRTSAADLAGIEKLNKEDIEATLAQDSKRLIEGWARDAVAFFPGSPPAVGKQAIWKIYTQSPHMKVLSYTSKYKNLQVEGGLAGEWFEKKAEYKLSPESPPISWHANGLLVLKRQSDGAWKAVMSFPIS